MLVDDIDAMYRRLASNGVHFLIKPQTVVAQPSGRNSGAWRSMIRMGR